jgi:hypothetical protein
MGDPGRVDPASAAADPSNPADRVAPAAAGPATTGPSDAEPLVGTLMLPSGPVPLHAARLDEAGVPVPPAPGTAALLDEGDALLVLLPAADLIPLDEGLTVAIEGEDLRERTVVEAQSMTAPELAEHVRTLTEGEFQIAAPATDGSWTVAELE